MNQYTDDFTMYDMHVHIFTPETCPIDYWAGKFRLTPKLIKAVQAIYEYFPKFELRRVERIIEDVSDDDFNFNAVAERFFCTPGAAYTQYLIDADRTTFLKRQIEPLILHVYENVFQGGFQAREALSAMPGGLPVITENYEGIKVYPKISGKPSETLLQWANDNGKPLFVHTSRGGIWDKGMFIDESEANAACHPISWCPYLEQYPDLKIVFCHGGGDSDFLRHGQDIENNWTDACIDVIDLYPNRVWIDTAYHQSVCSSPAVYKQALQQFCRAHSDNIVFGSDWPLILFDVPSYGAYINAFREAAGEYWHQMANSNPRRVLGME